MFIGHFGAAFALKPAARKVSLGTLFLAAQFLDLLWPVFLLLGVEHVEIDPGNTKLTPLNFVDYPITHSLLGACVWAVLVGAIYAVIRKYKAGAWVCGIAVLSGGRARAEPLGARPARAPTGPPACPGDVNARRPRFVESPGS